MWIDDELLDAERELRDDILDDECVHVATVEDADPRL